MNSPLIEEVKSSQISSIFKVKQASYKEVVDPKYAKIELTVEDGEKNLLKPQILRINALGLENVESLRKVKDGVTHFGSKQYFGEQKN